jgi:hypothetical protein
VVNGSGVSRGDRNRNVRLASPGPTATSTTSSTSSRCFWDPTCRSPRDSSDAHHLSPHDGVRWFFASRADARSSAGPRDQRRSRAHRRGGWKTAHMFEYHAWATVRDALDTDSQAADDQAADGRWITWVMKRGAVASHPDGFLSPHVGEVEDLLD